MTELSQRRKLKNLHPTMLLQYWIAGDYAEIEQQVSVTRRAAARAVHEVLGALGFDTDWSGKAGHAKREAVKRQVAERFLVAKSDPVRFAARQEEIT